MNLFGETTYNFFIKRMKEIHHPLPLFISQKEKIITCKLIDGLVLKLSQQSQQIGAAVTKFTLTIFIAIKSR